jgi:hypothetical protein
MCGLVRNATELASRISYRLQADIVFGVRPVDADIRSEVLIR